MNLSWLAFMSMAVQTSSAFYISCSFKKKIQISDSTAAAFTNAIALKFSLVLILLFCWIVFIQAPAFWLRMLGLNGREVLTRTRELKMFNVKWNTHEDKNHLLLLWQCVLFYAAFSRTFTNFQLFRILLFCLVFKCNWYSMEQSVFQSTLTLITFCVCMLKRAVVFTNLWYLLWLPVPQKLSFQFSNHLMLLSNHMTILIAMLQDIHWNQVMYPLC